MASLAAERLVDTLQQSFGALALLQNHLKAVEQRRALGIPWDPLGSLGKWHGVVGPWEGNGCLRCLSNNSEDFEHQE